MMTTCASAATAAKRNSPLTASWMQVQQDEEISSVDLGCRCKVQLVALETPKLPQSRLDENVFLEWHRKTARAFSPASPGEAGGEADGIPRSKESISKSSKHASLECVCRFKFAASKSDSRDRNHKMKKLKFSQKLRHEDRRRKMR